MNKYFLIVIPTIIMILIRLKPFDLLLRTFNTLAHELSHALIAVLFRQKVNKIALNKDFSGVCVTKIKNKKAMFFISIAGYTLPSIIAFVFIKLTSTNITPFTFYTIMIISIISIIFAIQNSFGRVWTICFAAVNFIFAFIPIFQNYYKHIIYIYACILMIENILSTITLFYITLINPKKTTDALLLKKATHIPSILWSLLFLCFAVFMFYLSIKQLA